MQSRQQRRPQPAYETSTVTAYVEAEPVRRVYRVPVTGLFDRVILAPPARAQAPRAVVRHGGVGR